MRELLAGFRATKWAPPDEEAPTTPIALPAIRPDSSHDFTGLGGPRIGDHIAGCRLLAELGRGTAGRAYLAEQIELANRPLVLKITDLSEDEHLCLARLQHTHLMPLYWAVDLPNMNRRVLAMPYLASTTLDRLLQATQGVPIRERHGELVRQLLMTDQAKLPTQAQRMEEQSHILPRLTWEGFLVRVGIHCAEALAYAHRAGILHLDVKPTNVLINPDGNPIVLDLNVARKPIPAGSKFEAGLGGTPWYMSPEQIAAMRALRNRQPTPTRVDGRSDLYSLGLVLFDALGGQRDDTGKPKLPSLRMRNPTISTGLSDLLTKLLSENPEHRYRDGLALAEDLQRHLDDRPLVGVANRNPFERWTKWRRRRPLGLAMIVLALGLVGAGIWAEVNAFRAIEEKRQHAAQTLIWSQELLRKGDYEGAVERLRSSEAALDDLHEKHPLRKQITMRLKQAERLAMLSEMRGLVHQMRYYALQDDVPLRAQHVMEAAARRSWQGRTKLLDHQAGTLEANLEIDIVELLKELVVLRADLQLRLVPDSYREQIKGEVRQYLREAEAIFGPSLAISLVERRLEGVTPQQNGSDIPTIWGCCAMIRSALENGYFDEADRHVNRVLDLNPLGFVPHYYAGIVAHKKGQADAAIEHFSFCLGREARIECLLLRGRAYLVRGDVLAALRDADQALQQDATWAHAKNLREAAISEILTR